MKVSELIVSYASEELGIKICDADTEKQLIPHIWRTDWLLINPITNEYRYTSFHEYDNNDVYTWEMIEGVLFIYIELYNIVSEWEEDRQIVCWNNLSEDEKSGLMLDIVSIRKPIDEEELEKLAQEYRNKEYVSNFYDPISADYKKEGFKVGYRKALEILKSNDR